MMEKDQHIEFKPEKKVKKEPKKGSLLKDLIDGTFLTREKVLKQIPFVLFLAFLAILYTANQYQDEKILRKSVALQDTIKELRSEEITIASDLMYNSKQSEVLKTINDKGLGLEESTAPPKKIVIKKKDFE